MLNKRIYTYTYLPHINSFQVLHTPYQYCSRNSPTIEQHLLMMMMMKRAPFAVSFPLTVVASVVVVAIAAVSASSLSRLSIGCYTCSPSYLLPVYGKVDCYFASPFALPVSAPQNVTKNKRRHLATFPSPPPYLPLCHPLAHTSPCFVCVFRSLLIYSHASCLIVL